MINMKNIKWYNCLGLGVSAAVVSYLVALYYNVIITWCLYYLKQSFQVELPWGVSVDNNGMLDKECEMSSSTTMYFWNRKALDTTGFVSILYKITKRRVLTRTFSSSNYVLSIFSCTNSIVQQIKFLISIFLTIHI
uniref:Uncharacterized protein n=1 Tax=Heterorhabditis bacteriophora TaxID=37862 RepID=A0A1I7WQM4_HETBA